MCVCVCVCVCVCGYITLSVGVRKCPEYILLNNKFQTIRFNIG